MAENFQVQLKKLRVKLDKFPVFQKLEDKTHIQKEYLVAAAGVALFLFFLFGNFAGFLWLVYWVVYSFFTILETFVIVIVRWIPFYFAFKLAFLIWLFYPSTKGATVVYNNIIKDLLAKYEASSEDKLDKAKKAIDETIKGAADSAAKKD